MADASAAVATERERQPPSRASATASATDGGATLPAGTIESGRAAGYRAVLKVDSPSQAGSYTLCLLAALSFFATSHGTALLLLALNCSTGFVTEAYVRRHPVLAGLQGAGLTALWSVASFIPFARIYDRWYAQHPRLRCQPDKVHSVQGYNRSEVRLALFNLIMAAVLSAVVVVTHVLYSWDKIYTDVAEHGYPYLLASTVAYFLLIDGWAYAGHRFLHPRGLPRRAQVASCLPAAHSIFRLGSAPSGHACYSRWSVRWLLSLSNARGLHCDEFTLRALLQRCGPFRRVFRVMASLATQQLVS